MELEYYKKYEPIDGKWYITKELGKGAFGTVFEVERRDFTNEKAAVKVITIPSSSSEVASYREENYELDEQSVSSYFYGFVEEFVSEFKLMSKLKGNSNVVSIEDYDVREHEGTIGWDIFIRMELLTPVNRHFSKNPPTKRDVIKLGVDICKALEVCQKYNIIHRDIKPSNIFVSEIGEYKLGDFGVARTLEKTSSGLSKKGTYTYMAPEVFRGDAYGSNVDLYSLGIVMYKLLNNNLEPFRTTKTHGDEETALSRRLSGEVPSPPANAEGRLAEIILKACSFNPKDRYESPRQLREELESILYTTDEAKAMFPTGDDVNYEPSASNDEMVMSEDDRKTESLFGDHVIQEEAEPVLESDEKTQGIFDGENSIWEEATEGDTLTHGIFDFDEPPQELQESGKEPKLNENSSSKGNKNKRFIVLGAMAVIIIACFVLVGRYMFGWFDWTLYTPFAEEQETLSYDLIVAEIEFVDDTGMILLGNSDIVEICRGYDEVFGSKYVSFEFSSEAVEKINAYLNESSGNILDICLNREKIATLTIEGASNHIRLIGPDVYMTADGFGVNGQLSDVELNHIWELLQTQPSTPIIPNEEPEESVESEEPRNETPTQKPPTPTVIKTTPTSVQKCSICGSTSHTSHPTCSVCGSADHTTHPTTKPMTQATCSVCGSTSHTNHPLCQVCGSADHTTHPTTKPTTQATCSVCGSTSHTDHPICQVCGSTAHVYHPTCPVCGSTYHSVHPSTIAPTINKDFD